MSPKPRPIVDRLDEKIRTSRGCWEWLSCKSKTGYGIFQLNGTKQGRAHRVVYELLVGTIPAELVLDHTCSNRGCVNPDHLDPVTQAENVRRSAAKKTHCPQGHPLSGDNLYMYRNSRCCKTCHRDRERVRRAKIA